MRAGERIVRSVLGKGDENFFAAGAEEADVGAALGIVPVIGILDLDLETLAHAAVGLDETTGGGVHDGAVGGDREEIRNRLLRP